MKHKEVLIFMGSHRSDANTAYIAATISAKLAARGINHKLYDVNRLNIAHCIDCTFCKDNWGACVHDDDMNEIYQDMKHARVVIFTSPVYFNGLSSKLKTLVDRCQMIFLCDFAHKKTFVDVSDKGNKKGYIVSVGGARAYDKQFLGNALSLGLVFDNLRMTLAKHLTYDNTDRISLKDNLDVEKDLQVMIDEITNRGDIA